MPSDGSVITEYSPRTHQKLEIVPEIFLKKYLFKHFYIFFFEKLQWKRSVQCFEKKILKYRQKKYLRWRKKYKILLFEVITWSDCVISFDLSFTKNKSFEYFVHLQFSIVVIVPELDYSCNRNSKKYPQQVQQLW